MGRQCHTLELKCSRLDAADLACRAVDADGAAPDLEVTGDGPWRGAGRVTTLGGW